MNRVLITLVLITLSWTAWAGDADAGKQKSASCVACHGKTGISPIPIYPDIAGQKAKYLELSMIAYREQNRIGGNAPMMWGLMAPLSDKDIADLAAFYAKQNPNGG